MANAVNYFELVSPVPAADHHDAVLSDCEDKGLADSFRELAARYRDAARFFDEFADKVRDELEPNLLYAGSGIVFEVTEYNERTLQNLAEDGFLKEVDLSKYEEDEDA